MCVAMTGTMASTSILQQFVPTISTKPARAAHRMQVLVCHASTKSFPESEEPSTSRRQALVASTTALLSGIQMLTDSLPARADILDDYKVETQAVITQVKETLALEKTDPAKPNAVASLRQSSNSWVAKYRREKSVSGKTSFSNMYSVLNAISGHYISFGPSSPIPAKRQQRILEEVNDAEKALNRGR